MTVTGGQEAWRILNARAIDEHMAGNQASFAITLSVQGALRALVQAGRRVGRAFSRGTNEGGSAVPESGGGGSCPSPFGAGRVAHSGNGQDFGTTDSYETGLMSFQQVGPLLTRPAALTPWQHPEPA